MTDFQGKKSFLYKFVKKLDLMEFMENEAGAAFGRCGARYRCLCPIHNERTPSCFVWQNDDDTWGFKCYGCGAGGSIIDFCMYFYELDNPQDALKTIIEKQEIDEDIDIRTILDSYKIKIDQNRKLDCTHFVSANNCRRLLKRYFDNSDIKKWVKNAYVRMNCCIMEEDIDTIEQIGRYAHKLLIEKKSTEGVSNE